jgi:hypothetical protein
MERKASIIRLWFLFSLIAVAGLADASLWFALAPLFWWCCCAGGCTTCADSFEGDMQVVLAGFANGTGFPGDSAYHCADAFNATHVLTNPTTTNCPNPGAACTWGKTGTLNPVTIFCLGSTYLIAMSHELSGSNYKSFVKIFYCSTRCGVDNGALVFEYDHGTDPVNCEDFSSLSMTKTTTGQNCGANCDEATALFPCDVSGVSATLSAL